MGNALRRVLGLYLALTLLTGIAYPLAVTLLAATAAPRLAGGSLVERHGVAYGSELLGQQFSEPGHFWSRPSATAPQPYHGGASAASNLGPTNPALASAITERVQHLRDSGGAPGVPVPVDLVTASASGLDPHISPAAAGYQVARVAAARGLPPARVWALVKAHTEPRTFGLLGEPRVNVVMLNAALDSEP